MECLFLFVDNSNIYIEAQRVARYGYHYDDELVPRVRISYGHLLDYIKGDRTLRNTVLVGSKPPANDRLWNRLKEIGVKPIIFERGLYNGKEKKVDMELTNCIRDALEENTEPGVIALVAGDKDYVPTLERCVKKGWKVEIYFWEQAAGDLKKMKGTEFHNLNSAFTQITFLEKGSW